jgi:hypothetical protein
MSNHLAVADEMNAGMGCHVCRFSRLKWERILSGNAGNGNSRINIDVCFVVLFQAM